MYRCMHSGVLNDFCVGLLVSIKFFAIIASIARS